VEVKYCEDTRPGCQLEAAHHQHSVLRQHLRQAAANVSLQTILLGVGGTIYSPLEPLKNLSLNPQKATKLAVKFHAHSDQYACELVSTRCALEKTFAKNLHQNQEWGTVQNAHVRSLSRPNNWHCALKVGVQPSAVHNFSCQPDKRKIDPNLQVSIFAQYNNCL